MALEMKMEMIWIQQILIFLFRILRYGNLSWIKSTGSFDFYSKTNDTQPS